MHSFLFDVKHIRGIDQRQTDNTRNVNEMTYHIEGWALRASVYPRRSIMSESERVAVLLLVLVNWELSTGWLKFAGALGWPYIVEVGGS